MKGQKIVAALLLSAVLLFTVPAVPVQAAASIKCSAAGTVILTSAAYSYPFKVTVQGSKAAPVVFTGNQKLFKTKLISHKGGDYYYQISGNGKAGDSTGLYISIPGRKAVRQCIFEMQSAHFSNGFFQAYGNYLYYNYDFALYRMNPDGSGKTKVSDENIGWCGGGFVIDADKIYYIDEKTEGLCQIGLDGKGKKQLTAQVVNSLSVYDHKIYYIAYSSNLKNDGGLLMRYDPANGVSERFASVTSQVTQYQIMDGSVYYSSTQSVTNGRYNLYCELESVHLDGSGHINYGNLPKGKYTRMAQDHYFYYMEDYSGKLLRMDCGTGEVKPLCGGIRSIDAVTPKWIYGSNASGDIVRVDLTSGQTLTDASMKATPGLSDFQIFGSSMYATFGYALYGAVPAAESNGRTLKESWDNGVNTNEVRGIARFDLDGNLVKILLASQQD